MFVYFFVKQKPNSKKCSEIPGITSTNGGDVTAVDVMSTHKPKLSAIPSTSATAEIVATSAPNIFFNDDDDGINKKHDRRLGDRSSLNGRTTSAGENVVNMLNVGHFPVFVINLFSSDSYFVIVFIFFKNIKKSHTFLMGCFFLSLSFRPY